MRRHNWVGVQDLYRRKRALVPWVDPSGTMLASCVAVKHFMWTLMVACSLQLFGGNVVFADAAPMRASPDRYLQLEGYLCELQRPARIYSYTWLATLGGLLIVQTTLAITADPRTEAGRAGRAGYSVGAGMTGLGIVLVGATSRPETNSCEVMRNYPAQTPAERLARLNEAERRLMRAGQSARRQTAWWMHGIAVLLGAGVGLGLGFGYSDNTLRATLQGVGTFAFTELRIWTRPTGAIGLTSSGGR